LRGFLLGALVFACPAASAADADLGKLLDSLGPAKVPKGGVSVTSWIEGPPAAADLVVRVEPHGAARIVTEPAVTVTGEPQTGVSWPAAAVSSDPPATFTGYVTGPVELRLPFRATGSAPVSALVEYAYCLVDYQCLFGEERVTAALPGT
jgi:hypothetical protein